MTFPLATSHAYRHSVHRMEHPEEFAHAVSGGSLAADFLAPREAATHVEQFQGDGWALDFHEAGVKARIRCELPKGWGSIGCMRSPAPSHWYGREARRGALVCTPPGEGIDGWITPGFSCLSIALPGEAWDQARELAGGRVAGFAEARIHLPGEAVFRELEHRMVGLRRSLVRAEGDSRGAVHFARAAAEFACDVLMETCASSPLDWEKRSSPRNRARLARRAEDWMRCHLGEPLPIPELCRTLRVSRRELEYAFRQVHDESPRDFLHALRLNEIRRALVREPQEGAVSRIAMAHGITHLGRFSAAYRRFFGENPGDSCRKTPRR